MNRFRMPAVRSGLTVSGLAAALVLTGCGAGQVSQTATQEPAVNGINAHAGDMALRNIHLRAAQTSDYVQPGTDVELLFVVSNQRPDQADELVSITSDVGTVTLSGDTEIPAGGALIVGEPDGQIAALETVEAVDAVTAEVALSQPITNGLTYDFTFEFERGGSTTVPVPISAGEAPRRDMTGEGGGGHTGGH